MESRTPADHESKLAAAEEVAKLLEMPGWKILARHFEVHASEALNDLAAVDPTKIADIIRLQEEAKMHVRLTGLVDSLLEEAVNIEEMETAEATEDHDGEDDPGPDTEF